MIQRLCEYPQNPKGSSVFVREGKWGGEPSGTLSGQPEALRGPQEYNQPCLGHVQASGDTVEKRFSLKSLGIEKLRWHPEMGGQVPPVPCKPGRQAVGTAGARQDQSWRPAL